ncbi:PAS domain-containing protein [Polaribacter sp. KT25b]|uniref:PAS domain-containing protein n=1 Tax=Polaribacter sp. KT25b TaxID=1855336 RepID=UPI0018D45B5A|nr:PAS domain-containing protein [Polaribacter sp. KT25b]
MNHIKKTANKLIIISCVFFSLAVIISWFTKSEEILYFFTSGATMKFNTALIFLLLGINLFIFDKKEEIYKSLYKLFSTITILLGLFTLVEYGGFTFFEIDNLFIKDSFSKVNPGRMSPATAICSILIGISFLTCKTNNDLLIQFGKSTKVLVTIISFISIISYILIIPSENKSFIFRTMAIHTSVLFFAISLLLMFKRENSIFNSLFFDKSIGSNIFRKSLPLIILIPAVIANAILLAINQKWLSIDFGLVTFTIILTPICIIYLSKLSINLNLIDTKRQLLENNLKLKNKNLVEFNEALDYTAIFSITNIDGKIKYANDSFCEISKYSREELIGSSHTLLNSGYHDNNFFKNLWQTIISGKIWTGDIKNKSKDGSFYTVNTTIIPIKNSSGNISDFLEINNKFTISS